MIISTGNDWNRNNALLRMPERRLEGFARRLIYP
jgi:hypothetical protein